MPTKLEYRGDVCLVIFTDCATVTGTLEAAAPLSLSPRPRLSISGNYESFDNPPLFWKTVLSKILRAENSLLVEITFNGAPCWTEASKGPIVMDGLQYIIQLEMQTLIKERKCIADTESNLII